MVRSNPPVLQAPPAEAPYRALARDVAGIAPDSTLLAVAPAPGVPPTPVVRFVLPERVLFAFDSDQPNGTSGQVLAALANEIRHDTPQAQVTILGHTDAIGTDAYNIALSRRRGQVVALLLEQRGIEPGHLSVVPIGKRQPVASNETAEGRAENRRVEFLISPDLATNRQAMLAAPVDRAYAGLPPPAPERLLDMAFAPASPDPGSPEREAAPPNRTRGVQRAAYPATARPAVQPATPKPAPHYDVRAPAPEVPLNALGSAKPY